LLLAIYGTIASTFIIGVLVKFAGDAGWGHRFGWLPAMLFGALISATDPVSVLAVFAEVNADINLYSMVYGESVLNDAVALVMYQTLLGFKNTEFSTSSALSAVGSFVKIFVCSALIGIFFSLALTLLLRYTNLHQERFFFLEVALFSCVPYASWMLSDGIHLSGIVAILSCGIGMSHWAERNLSPAAKQFTRKFFKSLSLLCETLVFIALGFAVAIYTHQWEWEWFLIATCICFTARVFVVYPVGLVCNFWRKTHKISQRAQFMLWLSGLRGPVAFALAFDTRSDPFFSAGEDGAAIFSATTFITFFTVFSIGCPAARILRMLDVIQDPDSTDPPITGLSARIMVLDEQYLGRYLWQPCAHSRTSIELGRLGLSPLNFIPLQLHARL
jgi:sodium/hydrogen exchanger 8